MSMRSGGFASGAGRARVRGCASIRPANRPRKVAAARDRDQRNARVSWRKVSGAVGYNVMWGVRPGRLTLTYQVFADELGADAGLDIRALNLGVGYYAAVEAFNETGVSKRSKPVRIR